MTGHHKCTMEYCKSADNLVYRQQEVLSQNHILFAKKLSMLNSKVVVALVILLSLTDLGILKV